MARKYSQCPENGERARAGDEGNAYNNEIENIPAVFEKCQSAVDELRHDFEGKYCKDDCVKCIQFGAKSLDDASVCFEPQCHSIENDQHDD